MSTEQERIERANKWLAEKCGVELLLQNSDGFYWKIGCVHYYYPWTITDARCRQIIREKLKIVTDIQTTGGFYAHAHLETKRYKGASIESAEIQCILSIIEQEEGSNEK